jgi:dTDP-glucose pyrophosphorylase
MAPRQPPPVAVKETDTAADAFAAIAGTPALLAVVTGRSGGKIVGTVTDSALRRAALRDSALSMPVSDVMARRPLIAPAKTKPAALDAGLRERRQRALALVDDKGKTTGVRVLPDRHITTAVLMVGGEGKRLRPLTDKVPKPLLRIGGTTIIERMIATLAAAGITDVYLTLNYKAEAFEERLGDGSAAGVRVHYLRERKPLGTAGALSMLAADLEGPVFVSNGDLVTTVDFNALFDFHWHHEGDITITGVEHLTQVPYGVLQTAEHHLLGIDEKPARRDFVSAGMYVLEPQVVGLVPPGSFYDMPQLIADVIAEGQPVHVFPVLEKWSDIGSHDEFEKVLLQFATGEEE